MHLSLFAYELYSDSKRDYHTVCVPITAQMTSLLMYDSTVYCVENDSMNDSLKIRDKLPPPPNAASGYLHGKTQSSFSCDLKHIGLKGLMEGRKFLS